MSLNIFDNDVACLLLSSNINSLEFEIVKSDDNIVFFKFELDEDRYRDAIKLIEKYKAGEVQVNLRKYNFNRKALLKKISKLKNAQ